MKIDITNPIPPAGSPIAFDWPIKLGPNERLIGSGPLSRLLWRGPRDLPAIQFGDADQSIYRAEMRDFTLLCGTIDFRRANETCRAERVISQDAPGDAWVIHERCSGLALRDCNAYWPGGAQYAVRSAEALNAVLLDHCSGTGGAVGLEVSTAGNGQVVGLAARDCVFQGAARNILLRGYVTYAQLDSVYCETADGDANVELRAALLAGKTRIPSVEWTGVSQLLGARTAILQRDAVSNICRGHVLTRNAPIVYRVRADGAEKFGAVRPVGFDRPELLVPDSALDTGPAHDVAETHGLQRT